MRLRDRIAAFMGKKAPAPQRRSVYAGAQQSRLVEDWVAQYMSGRDENRWELRLLKNRSREQCRNNPIARRYLGLCQENVLGAQGLRLQARLMTAQGEPDEETNQTIERAFDEWSAAETCTADRKQCWWEFIWSVYEAERRDGETLIEMLPGFGNSWGFAVRQIDIDLLDENYNQSAGEGRPLIVQGVELDSYGREIAFWLWNEHPTALLTQGTRRRTRVDAKNILHVGRPRRVGQVRYEPALTPVLIPLRMLDEYQTAELVAARTGAERLGWIQGGQGPVDSSGNPTINPSFETAKGSVGYLGADETFVAWDGNHPNQAFDAFQKAVLRQVAAGLCVSYASLTGDMSQSNYSSTRIAMFGERANWEGTQVWLGGRVCTPIYKLWLKQAVIWQQVRLPGPLADSYDHEWEAPGFDYIDPEKDVNADLIEVNAGLTSLTDVAAKKGRDFRDVLLKRKAEMNLADELGVELVLGKQSTPALPASPIPVPEPTDE